MKEKIKREQIQFVQEWEVGRQKGFRKHFIHSLWTVAVLILGIQLIDYLRTQKAIETYLIVTDVVIILFMSFGSWVINEARYDRIRKKYPNLCSEK